MSDARRPQIPTPGPSSDLVAGPSDDRRTDPHARGPLDRPFRAAVLTISDSRTLETDRSGARIAALLASHGGLDAPGAGIERALVPDEPTRIAHALDAWLDEGAAPPAHIELIVTTGGTGIAPRDRTIDVVRERLAVELPGFGELFRHLSFEEIGTATMLSRAIGGVARVRPDHGADPSSAPPPLLFALPGSTAAVELALTRLILPELDHMRRQLALR